MASLDWSQCPRWRASRQSYRRVGAPLNPDAAKALFENLEAGMSIDEVIEQCPVSREQLDILMAFVTRSLDKAPTYR
jgi:hypothetical protein